MTADLSCRCRGLSYPKYTFPCEEEAEGEDGLCLHCRVGDGRCCEDFDTAEKHMIECMKFTSKQMRIAGNGEQHTQYIGEVVMQFEWEPGDPETGPGNPAG